MASGCMTVGKQNSPGMSWEECSALVRSDLQKKEAKMAGTGVCCEIYVYDKDFAGPPRLLVTQAAALCTSPSEANHAR